jgi:replicative DNA helicase
MTLAVRPVLRSFDPDALDDPPPGMDRPIPRNLPAERAVLTCLFDHPEDVLFVQTILTPDDFFDLRHRYLYEAMLTLTAQRVRPLISTVSAELARLGRWELVGGDAEIFRIASATGVAYTRVDHYAGQVALAAIGRDLITKGGEIAGLGYEEGLDAGELLTRAEKKLAEVTQRRLVTPTRTLERVLSRYADTPPPAAQGALTGVPMGFRELDAMTGGLQKSDLIIIAARPAVGKSSLALSAAYHAATQHGKRIGIFTLEMSADQLGQRLMAIESGIPAQAVRLQTLLDSEWARLSEAIGTLAAAPIFFDDTPRLPIADLRRRARLLHHQHGCDLIIVDYLQLLRAFDGRGRRLDPVQEVTEITQVLKEIARDLDIPVLAMSQLSRAVESRDNKVPQLSDLRQSGSIEQDADIVMFIYRDELYHPDTARKGLAEIHVAKHRNGPVGVVPLAFHGPTTYFHDLPEQWV